MDVAGAIEQHVDRTDLRRSPDRLRPSSAHRACACVIPASRGSSASSLLVDVGGVDLCAGAGEGEHAALPMPCPAAVIKTVLPSASRH